jgi:hypothetical protein
VKTPHSLFKLDTTIKDFHTYVDGCSFTSGMPGTYGKAWPSFINESTINMATPGKDNFTIFNDAMYTINNYPIKRIIIYWTYPERFWLPIKENNKISNWSNKNIQPCFTVDNVFFDYVKMNLNFMYTLQELCKNKKIEYFYLTTVPYYIYEQGDNGLTNKINNVANWPGPYLNNNYHIWVNSLQILFGGYYNCVDKDGMHLNLNGHKLFFDNYICPFITNKKLEEPWTSQTSIKWIDSLSSINKEEAFKNARIKNNNLLNNLTTDYIYEQY